MSKKQLYHRAIDTFGMHTQLDVAVEELAELIQAITHSRRGRAHNVAEEIADVEIILAQLKIIYDCHGETAAYRSQKRERLAETLDEIERVHKVKCSKYQVLSKELETLLKIEAIEEVVQMREINRGNI